MTDSAAQGGPWTIDRFEETQDGSVVAVLVGDDGSEMILPRAALPGGVRRGDVLRTAFMPDAHETARRRAHVEDLQRRLFGPPDA